jgi:3-oxoacyl-[acyl-carrier protein] reductase
MTELSGRIALVTGASRGVGKAIAIALANAGNINAARYVSSTGRAGCPEPGRASYDTTNRP